MLEGVLKEAGWRGRELERPEVSILGMLEGVLKGPRKAEILPYTLRFNPWYVGGGVKSRIA